MVFSAKLLISAIASLAAVGAGAGIIYGLDQGSLSQEETFKLTEVDGRKVDRKVCNDLGQQQREKLPEICQNIENLGIKGVEENSTLRFSPKGDRRDDLNRNNSNLHLLNHGEDTVRGVKGLVKL